MEDKKTGKKIELLAPAGDYDCFLAAIKAGADAVYAGGNRFGARAYAGNFTQDELLAAMDHAHLHERKLYLTVNTLLKNIEIADLYDYICPLYEGGIDGIIVQDLGVIKELSYYFPDLPLHASTQMAVTGVQGALLLKELGIKRVVPARELSLDEIRDITGKTGMELECFIHGALCYSYSGKCLFSSIVGGRSGNRGRCAQPCRLPYDDKYILSARDISTIRILPELIEADIASFKIEGRMKSREYVAGVTGIYRKYIDRYLTLKSKGEEDKYETEEDDLKELDELYTRSGHCSGYYHMHNGRDMISVNKPSYNTAEDDRLKSLYEKYTDKDDIGCGGLVRAYTDENIKVRLECGGLSVECTGPVIERAVKQPTGEENIRKHFNKTGDTPFEFSTLQIEVGDDVFIPVSVLNSLRREAFDLLTEKMTSAYKRRCNVEKVRMTGSKKVKEEGVSRPLLNIRIEDISLFDMVLSYSLADIISIDLNEFIKGVNDNKIDKGSLEKISDRIHAQNTDFYIVLPPVIRHSYFERYKDLDDILCRSIVDGVIIDNYESLYYLKKIGFKGNITGDIHLYCVNDKAAGGFYELGADVVTYPIELNAGELNHLDIKKGEFILYGRVPMMISAQCVKKTCDKCVKDNGSSNIRDRYGNVFPVQRNCSECYNTILNCVPTMITSKKEIPSGISPFSYRIHLTVEDKEEAGNILDFYRAFFGGEEREAPIKRTLLHLKRGVE